MKRTAFLALAAMIGLLIAAPAHAVPLPPGSTGLPDTQTLVNPLTVAGNSILADTGPIVASNTLNGVTLSVTYEAWVVKVGTGDLAATNSGAQVAGNLDFVYQFTVNPSSNTFVNETAHVSFAGTGVGVDYFVQSAGQINPLDADRSSTLADNGATINFHFPGTVPPGSMSTLNIVETTATNFQAGNYTLQDGVNLTVSAFGVGPLTTTAVPEPSTMVVAGLGILGFVGYGLRRRKAVGA